VKRAALALLLLTPGCAAGTTEAVPSPTSVITAAAPTPSATPSPTPSPTPTSTIGPDGCRIRTPLPRGSVVSVVGDSYTTGEPGKGGVGERGWPAILAGRLGWTVHKDAQGASGYLSQGFTGKAYDGLLYVDQVAKLPAQKPDLVIVFGSDNDRGHTDGPYFEDKVRETLAAVKKAVPDADLLVATTFIHADAPSRELDYIRDVEKRETARIRCAVFVDPMAEHWFGSATAHLFYPNDDHPTDAGHLRLANLWQKTLTRLGYVD
jgi:lysophospholipase L1-like esterase